MERVFARGYKIWAQRTQLFLQAIKMILLFSLVITFFWCLYRIFTITCWQSLYYFAIERYVQVKVIIGKIINSDQMKISFYRLSEARYVTYSLTYFLKWFWSSIAGDQILNLIFWFEHKSFWELIRVFVISVITISSIFSVYGIFQLRRELVDGSVGLQDHQSIKRVFRSRKKNGVNIGDLKLPGEVERQHFLVTGTTGSGKTNFLKHLCFDIRRRKEKAVIFDVTGEFRKKFFQKGDIIINPFERDLEHVWNPWQEFQASSNRDLEVKSILNALLPPNPKRYDFFEDTARHLLGAVFKGCNSVEEVFSMFSEGVEGLKRRFATSELSFFVGEGSSNETTGSIIATAINAVLRLECLREGVSVGEEQQKTKIKTPFSVQEWIKKDEDSWLFLSVNAEERSSMKPLMCIWADLCIRSLMSKDSDERVKNTWIILDELSSFGYIPSLATGLAEVRKYGGCLVGATQNIAQLRSIYEYHDAQALIDLFSNKFVFRSGEFEIADYFSRLFGEEKMIEKRESMSFGSDSKRDSLHIGESQKREAIVSSTDILNLEDLACYIKIAGGSPISKIKFKIFK